MNAIQSENVAVEAVTNGPRIYVACLAAYNAGVLHGEWIDADQDAHDIREEIEKMLEASPEPHAEEWAIHDYDNFEGARLNESESLETVAKLASLVAEHGRVAALLFDRECGDVERIERILEEGNLGVWASPEDWAEDYLAQTGALEGLNDSMRMYFAFDRYAHDCELNGDIFAIELGYRSVQIFDGHI